MRMDQNEKIQGIKDKIFKLNILKGDYIERRDDLKNQIDEVKDEIGGHEEDKFTDGLSELYGELYYLEKQLGGVMIEIYGIEDEILELYDELDDIYDDFLGPFELND